ncbi:MAG: methylmalonyl-CoA epimerase [Halanaeroarchaeum sp.]
MHLDHVGVATDDVEGFVSLYEEVFELEVAHTETVDGMEVAFLDLGESFLEVLEPIEDDAAIASFLERNGPGMHHVAFAVEDLVTTLEAVRAREVETIDDEPRAGAWGHDVAFLHPSSTGGVLVELLEH